MHRVFKYYPDKNTWSILPGYKLFFMLCDDNSFLRRHKKIPAKCGDLMGVAKCV